MRADPPRLRPALVLAAGLYAFSYLPAASAAPEPFRLSYRLTSDGTEIAEVVQTLRATGPQRWRFESRVDPAGFLTALVTGRIEEVTELEQAGAGLRPLSYRFRRRGLGRDRDVRVRFDWPRQQVHNEVNGSRWSMAVPDDTLDKHALVLAVTADLRADRLAAAYPVADGGKLKTYQYQRAGSERLTTDLGRFDTVKLRRIHPGRQRDTLFWHAPALDHIPVRIERLDGDGRRLRLELIRYQRDPDATAP
jgi:hypothetical protein